MSHGVECNTTNQKTSVQNFTKKKENRTALHPIIRTDHIPNFNARRNCFTLLGVSKHSFFKLDQFEAVATVLYFFKSQ